MQYARQFVSLYRGDFVLFYPMELQVHSTIAPGGGCAPFQLPMEPNRYSTIAPGEDSPFLTDGYKKASLVQREVGERSEPGGIVTPRSCLMR